MDARVSWDRGDGLKFISERLGEFRYGYREEEAAGGIPIRFHTPNLTPRHRSVQIWRGV
jgi:hypothetical protein